MCPHQNVQVIFLVIASPVVQHLFLHHTHTPINQQPSPYINTHTERLVQTEKHPSLQSITIIPLENKYEY